MPIALHDDEASLRDAVRATLSSIPWRNKRDHELLVLTCFVDLQAVGNLIKAVAAEVRLKRARLMFDFSELYRRRTPLETQTSIANVARWCTARNITFDVSVLQVETLMHAKGYAVVQRVRDEVAGGAVWITSGNATSPGLGLKNANCEISSCSREIADIATFSGVCDELIERYAVSIERPIVRAREHATAYGILASGVFLHRWSIPLSARLALRYDLDEDASSRAVTVEQELLRRRLALERSSLTYRPLEIEAPRLFPSSFTRSYTLDTLAGRWCPKSIWSEVCKILHEDEAVRRFKENVRSRTTPDELAHGVTTAEENDAYLVKEGFVPADSERIERWRGRIEILRDDDETLTRICLSMEAIEFPYPFEDRKGILDVWKRLEVSERIARRESTAKALLRRAREEEDPSAMALNDDERDALAQTFDRRRR